MANVDLSVIMPSKNNKDKIIDLIRHISDELKDREVEFIIIDMNSTDNSVVSVLDEIKNNNLRGCVIQSGGGNISSALNTGIYKACGEYITFVFAGRLYKNYIADYIKTAEKNNSDFVFAVPSSNNEGNIQTIEKLKNNGGGFVCGTELLGELIKTKIYFEFTAVMIRREFLLHNHIKFYEDCNYGYLEAFIYNLLLRQPLISYSEVKLEREPSRVNNADPVSNSGCYGRIEAMLKVYENCTLLHKSDKLNDLFEYIKLPSVVMSIVDILKKENFSYAAIKKSLKQKGYDKLLKVSSCTPKLLRKKIILWKTVPWMYKP